MGEGSSGRGGGSWMKARWCHKNCSCLAGAWKQLLLLAYIMGRKSCNLPVSLAQQMWNCVMFSWLYFVELKENSSPWVLGQLAQHYVIRIIFNTLNVINSVGPNRPHAMGWAPLNRPYWKGLKWCCCATMGRRWLLGDQEERGMLLIMQRAWSEKI